MDCRAYGTQSTHTQTHDCSSRFPPGGVPVGGCFGAWRCDSILGFGILCRRASPDVGGNFACCNTEPRKSEDGCPRRADNAPVARAHTGTDANTSRRDAHPHSGADGNSYRHADPNTNCHTNADTDRHAYSGSDSYFEPDCHSDADCHPDPVTHRSSHRSPYPGTHQRRRDPRKGEALVATRASHQPLIRFADRTVSHAGEEASRGASRTGRRRQSIRGLQRGKGQLRFGESRVRRRRRPVRRDSHDAGRS